MLLFVDGSKNNNILRLQYGRRTEHMAAASENASHVSGLGLSYFANVTI